MTDQAPSSKVPPPAPQGPTLATQLRHTAACVQGVVEGRSLTELLPAQPPALRPGIQALSFHVLRHLGMARAIVALLAQRKPAPAVHALLCSAVALLLDGSEEQGPARYAPHTVVNQAVEAARKDRRIERQAAFVNACLRRFLRERTALIERAGSDPVARWNHPLWWIQRLQHDHPEHWQAILNASNQPGPMALRVNRRRTDRAAYRQALQAMGLASHPLGSDGLVLEVPQPVERLPGFAEGHCSVQDGAAQMAAGLLLGHRAWAPTDRVLDACAAPGGKTAHLLERADLSLLALDVDPSRCERIEGTLQRLGLHAQVRCADAAQPDVWWDGQAFDAILLDAPCTASGIVRRHPDVRWLRRASDVDALVATQRALLEALWPLLKPGGRLVYATCSVFRAEGAEQLRTFLVHHTDACQQPSPGHLLPGLAAPPGEFNDNHPGGHDGFFYACIDKAAP